MIATDCFNLYGVNIAIRSDSDALRSIAGALLGPFATDLSDGPADFQCSLTSDSSALSPQLSIPPDLRPRHREMGSSYYAFGHRSILIAEGGAIGMADMDQGEMVLYIPPDSLKDHTCCTQHNLFRLLLLDLLRTVGIFPIHAAAAALGELGVLVSACKGGGKSTFGIALARAGLAFLVDDVLLLRRTGCTVEALYLPNEVELRPESLVFFPELAALRRQPLNGRGKVSLKVAEAYPGRTIQRCVPGMILFPRMTYEPESHLMPLSEAEAACRLLPQSQWWTKLEYAKGHWALLRALLEQCSSYELALGTNLDAATRLVIDKLKPEETTTLRPAV